MRDIILLIGAVALSGCALSHGPAHHEPRATADAGAPPWLEDAGTVASGCPGEAALVPAGATFGDALGVAHEVRHSGRSGAPTMTVETFAWSGHEVRSRATVVPLGDAPARVTNEVHVAGTTPGLATPIRYWTVGTACEERIVILPRVQLAAEDLESLPSGRVWIDVDGEIPAFDAQHGRFVVAQDEHLTVALRIRNDGRDPALVTWRIGGTCTSRDCAGWEASIPAGRDEERVVASGESWSIVLGIGRPSATTVVSQTFEVIVDDEIVDRVHLEYRRP